MLQNKTVAFLGAGSMAEAMISGIVHDGKIPAKQVIATNKSSHDRLQELSATYGITAVKRDALDYGNIDIFILAMKPKHAEDALSEIKDRLRPDQLILSVLAGISTSFIEERLNAGQQVIRVMPNTSSMIGESATAITPGKHAAMDKVQDAKMLLQGIGGVSIIDEDKMDVFTGIAGSGPAYIYYLVEHIEKTGMAAGLDKALAREIAVQTIFGASKMLMETDTSPTDLRENVTSPNGTTAAGLEALEKNGGGVAIAEAIKGAAERSKEISAELQKTPIPN
ncbi:pyrroline-5-carboxylate reductase [Scopulibacillus darangshiensis]|uniref:Pyrroline-5-carboxylate reductase n=1 Tax=Scopulibacillus darangshiensis TaxID=442528 RepID=A0A4R2P5Y1_9BACL|nr:pyrroline-5-carboxylate reductase [Scopulibacillus darangshiensis]TCP30223.1 pyrroline-5-carboxylate reductase [Scopulibacillus darangshiensis]